MKHNRNIAPSGNTLPLHIVHVVRQYSPGIGGIESFVENLAREQVRLGHRVRVVTLNRIFHTNSGILPEHEFVDGIEIQRVPYRGSYRYPLAPKVLKHVSDADIVHVHAIDFIFDYLALTKAIHQRKLVVSTHGGFFHTDQDSLLKKIFFATVTRTSLTQYDYVAASSAQDDETFRRIRTDQIGLIENGVNVDKFRDKSSNTRLQTILSFGRLAPNKNVSALFPFLREVRKLENGWKLVVAGVPRGVEFSELESAARAAGVSEAVEFFDSPTDEELRGLISRSSVFASASKYEGFGIAPIEAMSAGLLPTLSDIPPHRRTLEAAGIGALVDFSAPGTAAATFLSAWKEWCLDFPARRAHAVRSAESYAWPSVAGRFDEVYRAVIG